MLLAKFEKVGTYNAKNIQNKNISINKGHGMGNSNPKRTWHKEMHLGEKDHRKTQ